MNDWTRETLHETLCRFPGASLEYPFDDVTRVYKVGGKMFALFGEHDDPPEVNLKCEPERAEELRLAYECVKPGWHMNKRHWNTVTLDGSVEVAEVWEWIQHSYDLVVASLTRAQRAELLAPPSSE